MKLVCDCGNVMEFVTNDSKKTKIDVNKFEISAEIGILEITCTKCNENVCIWADAWANEH